MNVLKNLSRMEDYGDAAAFPVYSAT